MKNPELVRQFQRLRSLMTRACSSTDEIELRAQWARYFTVLAAGLIENSVPLIYGEYVKRTANNSVANFALAHLEQINNPKSEKLVRIARQFDDTWAFRLEAYLEDEGRKEAIDGIMNTRHQVAHGKNTGITIASVTQYINKTEDVLSFMETQVMPHGTTGLALP